MTRCGATVVGLLVFLAVAVTGGTAEAQPTHCDIHAIRALPTGAVIAEALTPFRTHLLREPLNSFNSFELISTEALTLTPGNSGALQLPGGISGELTLVSATGTSRVLALTLRRNNQNLVSASRISVSPGHPFFVVVGSVIPTGSLVLGITCR